MAYQYWGDRTDALRMPPRGRLVNVGSHFLHLYETGDGQPAVVLESGISGSSLTWSAVQPQIATVTSVISYDRAGLGWSTAARDPIALETLVADLRRLLQSAVIPAPYVLVGHSFGGLLVRAYAHRFPNEVAGLVLVDPVSIASWAACTEDQRRRLALGIKLSRRGALLARFGVVRFALHLLTRAQRRIPQVIAKTTARKATRFLDRIVGEVRRLPPELWPAVQAHWSRPKSFRAMAAHLSCLEASAKAAFLMEVPAHIPTIVLSASSSNDREIQEREAWIAANARSEHRRISDCGHWIPLERPEAVVLATLELIEFLREDRRAGPS
ncbi:MAG: alpha/beta fold hydrolase [Acidobacteriaceae bacterium]|nr:alpha/beta fold hydrolase [Acidobacteriaceae bacterium]